MNMKIAAIALALGQVVNPPTGGGNTATGINGATAPNSATVVGTNGSGQLVNNTSLVPLLASANTFTQNQAINGTTVGTGMAATGYIGFDTGQGGFAANSAANAILYGNANALVFRGLGINDSTDQCALFSGGFNCLVPVTFPAISTTTNCASSVGTCGSAASGSVTVAAAATTRTVSTTAITANSVIQLTFDSSLGTKLGVTCNTTQSLVGVSARVAGTSFTLTTTAPAANPACFNYLIIG